MTLTNALALQACPTCQIRPSVFNIIKQSILLSKECFTLVPDVFKHQIHIVFMAACLERITLSLVFIDICGGDFQVPAPDAVFDYVMADLMTTIVVELMMTPAQVRLCCTQWTSHACGLVTQHSVQNHELQWISKVNLHADVHRGDHTKNV